ncbi:MAG: hypothetical protein QHH06_01460 [Clostridiales bacterium]|jgi:tetratricopeptide (TPR) repeat protein|nr:hypothetical protein [Eubacteriales bacterium]MDH7565136.1 hypothetical protein [Clostridiales bacterium]
MLGKIERLLENKLISVGVIAVLTLTVYSNSFTAPFTLDDYGSIVNNYAIRNPLDLSAIWHFYSNRFILYFTLSVNYFIHGTNVIGYHITNVVIHIFNGALFFLILHRLLGLEYFSKRLCGRYRSLISLLCALVFISHPVQVNAVTYLVQRTAALAASFYLLSILFFIQYRIQNKARYFIATMLFTLLAMFTKENTITIPFMLTVLEIIFFMKDPKTSWVKRGVMLFLLFLTIPVIPGTNLVLHGYSQSDPGVNFKASTSMDRFHYFYTELNVLMVYIKLLLLPDRLNFDYSNDFPMSYTLWDHYSYISLMILGILFIIGLYNIKRNKLAALGILWFFITISVESSFISIKDVYFEHRLYLPLAGFILCIAGFLLGERKQKGKKYLFQKPILFFLSVSLVMILQNSIITLQRNFIFSDGIRLWSDVVSKAPNSDRAHSILGGNYLDSYENNPSANKGHLALAEAELKKAIQLNGSNDTALCNLAKVYLLKNEYAQCIDEAKKANRIQPSIYAYNNMGMAYRKMGRTDDAIQAFLSGLNIDKKSTFLLENLGDVYFDIKDFENARYYYNEYLKNTRYPSENVKEKLSKIESQVSKTQ